jgi:hypothetical protein
LQGFAFEGGVEGFGGGVISAWTDRAAGRVTPRRSQAVVEPAAQSWAPLSLWKIAPFRVPPRVAAAASRESITRLVRIWSAIDQPP